MFVSTPAASTPQPGVARQRLGQRPCVRVVLGQARPVVRERVERRRREDARLPHRAAPPLAKAPRLLDERAWRAERAAHRRAEPLREADARRCRTARTAPPRRPPLATLAFQMRAPSRCVASPSARARSRHRARLRQRPDAPARAVVGVLDRHERRARRPVRRAAAPPPRRRRPCRSPPRPATANCTPLSAAPGRRLVDRPGARPRRR